MNGGNGSIQEATAAYEAWLAEPCAPAGALWRLVNQSQSQHAQPDFA
jgi:hypothetical protein